MAVRQRFLLEQVERLGRSALGRKIRRFAARSRLLARPVPGASARQGILCFLFTWAFTERQDQRVQAGLAGLDGASCLLPIAAWLAGMPIPAALLAPEPSGRIHLPEEVGYFF